MELVDLLNRLSTESVNRASVTNRSRCLRPDVAAASVGTAPRMRSRTRGRRVAGHGAGRSARSRTPSLGVRRARGVRACGRLQDLDLPPQQPQDRGPETGTTGRPAIVIRLFQHVSAHTSRAPAIRDAGQSGPCVNAGRKLTPCPRRQGVSFQRHRHHDRLGDVTGLGGIRTARMVQAAEPALQGATRFRLQSGSTCPGLLLRANSLCPEPGATIRWVATVLGDPYDRAAARRGLQLVRTHVGFWVLLSQVRDSLADLLEACPLAERHEHAESHDVLKRVQRLPT